MRDCSQADDASVELLSGVVGGVGDNGSAGELALLGRLEDPLQMAQDVSCLRHHLVAGSRWAGAAVVPMEQLHTAPSFERGEPMAGRWLGDQQLPRRRAHGAMPDDRDDEPQVPDLRTWLHMFSL